MNDYSFALVLVSVLAALITSQRSSSEPRAHDSEGR
jgi:hypothetical protein